MAAAALPAEDPYFVRYRRALQILEATECRLCAAGLDGEPLLSFLPLKQRLYAFADSLDLAKAPASNLDFQCLLASRLSSKRSLSFSLEEATNMKSFLWLSWRRYPSCYGCSQGCWPIRRSLVLSPGTQSSLNR